MNPLKEQRAVVLVVEDEAILRLDAAAILAQAGYDVLEASDALQALAALETSPRIDILFTDINLPGAMDGLELARRFHQVRPDIRLAVTSGHVPAADAEVPDDGAFIPKPYSPEMVRRAMSRLLS